MMLTNTFSIQGVSVRKALSPIELSVTMGIALTVLGLILPAVQAIQKDAARASCIDNMRKLGQGFAEFEKTNGGFPARRTGFNNGAPYGGWGPLILGSIGEEELAKKYDPKLDCFDIGNKEVVETQIKTFLCPAAPVKRKITIQGQASSKSSNPDKDKIYTVEAAPNDYISSNGVLIVRAGYGLNAHATDQMNGNARQPLGDDEYLPLSKITDGLSCTILLIEQAGRPGTWRLDKKKNEEGQFGMSANARGAWAGWGSIAFGASNSETGETPGKGNATDCTVNCNNWFGIYSFHKGGGHILLCDGSVRFVSTKLDPLTFAYLTLRDDGHAIDTNDY